MAAMLHPKPKSGVADPSISKTTPATPTRVSKLSRAGSTKSDSLSPSPLQNRRPSIDRSPKSTDRSPKSVDSKPTVERRSPKIGTPPDKQVSTKGPELQAKLGVIQEDLKKAREQLALVEQEKAQALKEVKDAKRLADESSEKLKEALVAQKRAEESSEIEKFRADELEQSGIEAAQKREEEWQNELEAVRNKHSVDAATLLSSTQELQILKNELALTTDAKNTALSHADDAMKIAEINAEKVELLSGEVSRLKALLDSKMDSMSTESAELVKKLDTEVDALKHELEGAKTTKEKLVEMEALVQGLTTEVTDVKRAEMDACKLVDEWKKKGELLDIRVKEADQSVELVKKLNSEINTLKHELERAKSAEEKLIEMEALVEGLRTELTVAMISEKNAAKQLDEWKMKAELLEVRVEEASLSKKSSMDSLASVEKQLEESNALLQDVESEVTVLKEMVVSLETEVARRKEDLKESDHHLDLAQQEVHELGQTFEVLKLELQKLEEEKQKALNDGKVAALNVENLSEDRNKLINELETVRDEEEKVKKAMEGLTSALHEVSTEARENQERLLTKQAESENAHAQIEELKSALTNSAESYQVMLDEARYEIVCLGNSVERYEAQAKSARDEWEAKELNFFSAIKKSEEEHAALKVEMRKVVDSLKGVEHELQAAKEDAVQVLTKLGQAESEVSVANEAAEQAKADSLHLKETLLDKENELQSIIQENDDLRIRDAAASEKIRELSALLVEATAIKAEENGESMNREKEYDLLQNTVGYHEGESEAEKPKPEESLGKYESCFRDETQLKEGNGNGNQNVGEEPVEVESKTWVSHKVMDKDSATEREDEGESSDDDVDLKMDSGRFELINGLPSTNTGNGAISSMKSLQKKKKTAFISKFGSLLKKKSNHN